MTRRFAVCLMLLLLWVTPSSGQSGPQTIRVLFLGNSYIYYHELPDRLTAIASTGPQPIRFETAMVAEGGYTLEDHWRNGRTLEKIREGQWNFVVLQEQSMRPLENPQRMFEAARLLDISLTEMDQRTVLFMTWARENRPEMTDGLTRTYRALGDTLGALVAPVGEAWARVRTERPDLELYDPDQSHPNMTGTYLTAYVLYAVLTDHDPRALPDDEVPPLPPDTAAFLQHIAWATVQGSP